MHKLASAERISLLTEQKSLLRERERNILIELKNAKDLKTEIDVNAELKRVEEALEKIKLALFQQKIDFKQNRFAEDKIGD